MGMAQLTKITVWLWLLYAIIGASNLLSVESWLLPYEFFFAFKVAIIPILMLVLLLRKSTIYWLWVALLFSWGGDIAIHFHFLLGVGSFTVAHIAYIYGLNRWRARPLQPKWWFLIFILLYLSSMLWFLLPHTGGMTPFVIAYGIIISTTLGMALHVAPTKGKEILVVGVLFFVVSDSILAISNFAIPFTGSRVLVMSTYILAQGLMVAGILKGYKKVSR